MPRSRSLISLIEKIRPCAFCPILRPFNRSGKVGECAVTDRPEDSPHVGIAIRFDKREYVIGATELAQVKIAGSINADSQFSRVCVRTILDDSVNLFGAHGGQLDIRKEHLFAQDTV